MFPLWAVVSFNKPKNLFAILSASHTNCALIRSPYLGKKPSPPSAANINQSPTPNKANAVSPECT